MKIVPPERRNVVFSLKQAGVPLGGLVAGLLLPATALVFGVAGALVLASVMALAVALALGYGKVGLDLPPARQATPAPFALGRFLATPLRMARLVLGTADLRLLTFAGLSLAVAQGVLLSFYPVLLSDGAGWSLTAAGAAFALLQGVGIFGRILAGWLTDRFGNGRVMLALMGLASGGTMLAIAACGAGTPVAITVILAALAGITVISWNGIFLSELAVSAPQGMVGAVTSAGTFVLFAGYVVSPLLAEMAIKLSGGYQAAYALAGLIPIVAAVVVLLRSARK